MDDLAGLSWNNASQSSKPANPTPAPAFGSYPSLRPSPSPFVSGRNTPLSAQGSGTSASKPATKAPQDSFSNLVNFGASKPNANLSLKEQQERLEAEKRKKEEERRKNAESQFGGHFLDSLGSGATSRTSSPAIPPPSNASKPKADDDDLFAAFRSDTKVNNASHYPPPTEQNKPTPPPGLDLSNPASWNATSSNLQGGFPDEDDDPFGLNTLSGRKPTSNTDAQAVATDEDDFLGDLGRPVEEVRQRQQAVKQPEPGKPIELSESDSEGEPAPSQSRHGGEIDPFDKAVAQLVDYGFTPENARRGLTESGAGLNVQAAVNWLLDDAHRQSKEKAKGGAAQRSTRSDRGPSPAHPQPSWARDNAYDENRPQAGGDDLAKTAAAMGTSFLKTANSLWKTGQKKVQKAVADFQHEGDPNQPKWMRSAQQDRSDGSENRPDLTDEAMMLNSGGRPNRRPIDAKAAPSSSRERSPAFPQSSRQSPAPPKWQQQQQSRPLDARSRLNRLTAEDDDVSTYVSPNRRRKAAPSVQSPKPQPPPVEEPDLLFSSSSVPTTTLPQRPAQRSPAPAAAPKRDSPPMPKPTPRPTRQIPAITPAALQTSTKHRLEGTAHFKRGDYASAHLSYSSSLSAVPATHPLAIVLLTNRALTSLKTGEPKKALEDADQAINLIGPSLGQGETVAVKVESGSDEHRDMKDLYGKALSRKAEALEQMERWADAGAVWQLCVEAGVGGSTAIAGRQRCQKALAPRPKPASRPVAAKQKARPSAMADLGPQKSSEAVERLRAANQAAAREDEEKFEISERVDAKMASWRDGKRDNLRALLSSLDQVLWEGSGWKKVGLHELVMANKVKIIYMKAIAKTHPDKLPQDASTEVRLIAATVFSTLNESWDKFKAENGL
ncbi:hypothetical protein jhhlp_002465 [Lomentospora prolificans]|uniref:UBA domain-containing protein n=1 Tax=Lomentospora prolificans TaxID=41688 RepID=A0A2N3NE47_9PEZI|nr:hypothetical protein jhhlp_002465 [Lomentospora prolificans]